MRISARVILVALAAFVLSGAAATAASFDAQHATDVFLSAIDAGTRQRAAAYADASHGLDVARGAGAIVAALLILMSGLSRALRNLAEGLAQSRTLQVAISSALFLLVMALLMAPLEYYRGFLFERQFGHAVPIAQSWWLSYVGHVAIALAVLVPVFVVFYALLRRFPHFWWLSGGVASTLLAGTLVVGAPFIMSLLDSDEPMSNGPLKQHVMLLARSHGVPANEVYRSHALGYDLRSGGVVAAWFGRAHISIGDNLLDRAGGSEIRAIVGREIGHRRLNHTIDFLEGFALFSLIVLFVAAFAFRRIVKADGAALGLREEADPASVPLLFALIAAAGFLAMPALKAVLRAQETAANNFSLNVAREPDGLATMALRRAATAKLDPPSWEQAFFSSHPDVRSIVLQAMQWKAAHLSTSPVSSFEVEVGCSPDRLQTPAADIRWIADGTPLDNLRVDVAVTKSGFALERFVSIQMTAGRATLVTADRTLPPSLELAVDPPAATRPEFAPESPRLVALRVNNLAPGVLYFWRVGRTEGAMTETLRTDTSTCPADVEED